MATEGPSLTPEEQEVVNRINEMDNEQLVTKIKYLGMQMETMEPKEKVKYSGHFDTLAKSLGKLRRVLRKKLPEEAWHLNVWLCVTILVLIYG